MHRQMKALLPTLLLYGSPHCLKRQIHEQLLFVVLVIKERWAIHDSLASIVGTLETIFGFTHHTGNVLIQHSVGMLKHSDHQGLL